MTRGRYLVAGVVTLWAGWFAYESLANPPISPTGRWLVPLAWLVVIAVSWWGALHLRVKRPWTPERHAALARWLTVGSATIAIASLVAFAVWLALRVIHG